MPDHLYRLWRSGLCPELVPAGLYEDRGGRHVLLQTEGLIRVCDYAVFCPDGIEDSFCTLLLMLASAAESFLQLQQWLAEPAYISIYAGDLFYDRERQKTLLVLCEEADPRPFFERFCETCVLLGGSGSLIASRLEEGLRCRVTGEKGTAAFLRNWRAAILRK